MKKLISILFLLAFSAGALQAEECSSKVANHHKEAKTKTIVGVADEAGSFKTLLAAAKAAGLVDTLNSEGPFTVFAPSDAAFAKLPEGTVEALLQDPDKLKAILLYHVVPGKMMAADVVKKQSLKSAQGNDITLKVSDAGVMVDGANVVTTDIKASNGVIHVIDSVIIPQ